MSDVALAADVLPARTGAAGLRRVVVGLTAFLTLVDLFAVQAILPSLAAFYGVTASQMGLAANASTFGMAAAGIAVAFLSRRIDRRLGIAASLALLAIPTTLLAWTSDLGVFAALRVLQGVFMSAAFTLTMAHLAEETSAGETAAALAAYITGNVASNLFGRLISASATDLLGLAPNFLLFAALNLAGAMLVFAALKTCRPAASGAAPLPQWRAHFRNPALRAGFAIGFLILFVFIGTFTYVNFVLARPPLLVSPMALGFVYLVFLPSLFTTPLAGRAVQRLGTRLSFWAAIGSAAAGLPLLVLPTLAAVLAGLVLVAAGTFFAQAATTGFVGRAATADRGSASGLYLASYYLGGLAGSAVLGAVFEESGWGACVAVLGASLLLAAWLGRRLRDEALLSSAAEVTRCPRATRC